MKSLKSTLTELNRKVHQDQIPQKSDSAKIQRELEQMGVALGTLMENVNRIVEMVGISNEYLQKTGIRTLEESEIRTGLIEEEIEEDRDKTRPSSSEAEISDSGALEDAGFTEIKEEEGGSLSDQSESISESEIQTTEEENWGKGRLEKFKELKQHLNQVTRMVEERSSLGEDSSREEEDASSPDQEEEVQDPDRIFADPAASVSPPQPEEETRGEISGDESKEKGEEKKGEEFTQSIQALKSSMNSLERLSFEQYLHDLHAYDPQNREFAVHRLGMMRSAELAGLLLDIWEKEEDITVRSELLNALLNMDYQEAIPYFKNALGRGDPRIVVAALEGLYRFKGEEAGQEFVKALDHSHYSVRRRAATYLGWMQAEWAIPYLVKLLRDPDVYNRKVGVNILSNFRVKQVVFFLVEALNDPDQRVREAVIKVLNDWTGRDMGYDPRGDEKERREATHAWKQWWDQSEAEFEFQPKGKKTK